ncbi:MAG: hypothetical protein GX131_12350 [candidate division WS1 bacterium]|jgi:hypothetical protein|nr:hypothetical protein [candidate division WS1 bacterium]
MLCPQCQQGVQNEELAAGACPWCGFPCDEFHRRVSLIQLVLGALFASTLIYGVIVAVLELTVRYQPPGLGDAEFVLGMALMGATAGLAVASIMFDRRARGRETIETHQRMVIILGAIAEAPAIFGLVMYLLAGSLQWMVLFLLVSWALMIRLGTRLPHVLRGMRDCLRAQ